MNQHSPMIAETESTQVRKHASAACVFRRSRDAEKSTPFVSVIMSAHDEEPYVESSVRSILAQTYAHLELIIIDDGSNDATPQILGAIEEPRLRLLRQDNTGQMVARNRGIRLARGEFITFMDADDLCHPSRIQKLVAYLIAHPELHGVGSWGTYIDARGDLLERVEKPCDPIQIRRLFARGEMALNGMSVMMRSEVLRAVGGFREQFKQSEDFDLWLRVTEKYNIACLPEYLYYARRHPRSCSLTRNREQAYFKNLALELRAERLATGSDRLQRGEGIEIPEFEEESGRSLYRRTIVYNLTRQSRACAKAGRWGAAVRYAAKSWRHHPFAWRPWLFLCKTITGALIPSTRPHLDAIRSSLARAAGLPHRKPVYLVIRYDDFGAAYSDACAGRFKVEEMLQREMAARGWPWLCSITPRQSVDPLNAAEQRIVSLRQDTPRVNLLCKAVSSGLCEPAVHGLTHRTWKQLPEYGTEFAGLPLPEQRSILRAAKEEVEALVGKTVAVFVPPWNSYDDATVRAAGEVGFDILSAGLSNPRPRQPPMHMVPCTADLPALKTALDRRKRFSPGSVVVLLFHAYDFVEADPQNGHMRIGELGPLLDRMVAQFRMTVVPSSCVPRLVGSELDERVQRAGAFQPCYFSLPHSLPLLGTLIQRWTLPHRLALLPVRRAVTLRHVITCLKCAWLPCIAVLACVPAWLISTYVDWTPARRAGLLAIVCTGLLIGAHSARNALMKRYRGWWGTRTIGLRTWAGLTAGFTLALSVLIQWAIP